MSEERFHALFGRAPKVDASAAGRVNLIGEHTDYNGGFVLPTPIPQRTRVFLAPRDDEQVRVSSAQLSNGALDAYRLGEERRGRNWPDYVQGVTSILRHEGFELRGFDAYVDSRVPIGSGLSSSAALEIAIFRALRDAFGLALDEVRMARIGRRVENEFVGAQTGIMDQMACSLGEPGKALFLDTRSLEFDLVSIPAGVDLIVLNSGVSHNHAAGNYNTRRAECERAAEMLGVLQLRDLDLDDLPRISSLPEPLDRRARHVVTEDARVIQAVAALRSGDLDELGRLFYASHASMRDDYVVSVPEIDLIVEIARGDRDIYGARLTGGGFGGSVVMISRAGAGRDAAARIADQYARQSGQTPTILVPGD